MCKSLNVAVNKCINWCFVHLYLLFYYKNNVFLSVINNDPPVFHCYEDREPYILGSWRWPDVTHRWALSYWWSMMTMHQSCTVTEIRGIKDFGVTTLTFWGHVTSLVTWPLDLAYAISYWWSIVTMHISVFHRYGDIKPQTCRPVLKHLGI